MSLARLDDIQMSNVVSYDRYAQAQPAERPLPADRGLEEALLGTLMVDNTRFGAVASVVAIEHFSDPLLGACFDVLSKSIGEGRPATPLTMRAFLPIEAAPGLPMAEYLARMWGDACVPAHAVGYARAVAELFVRRKAIEAARETIEQAFDWPVDQPIARLVDGALETLRTIGDVIPSEDGEESVEGTLGELIAAAHDRAGGKADTVPSSGLSDIDRTLGGGLRPGRLIVLAGRPGAGKTVLATAIARRTAAKGSGVALFSLEIDRFEAAARLAANAVAGGIEPMDYRDVLTGTLSPGQIERLGQARDWLRTLPLEICDRGGLSMAQIETRAVKIQKAMVRRGRALGVVMIDYLGLVRVEDRYRGNQVAEYGDVALAAKTMAKRLGVCVVLLAQLNRSVESRDSKRPLLSDLRASGNIEEHADAVGMLYRPSYYDKHDPKVINGDPEATARADGRANLLELIWEKNRLGPTTTDQLYCNVARSQVDSIARARQGGWGGV